MSLVTRGSTVVNFFERVVLCLCSRTNREGVARVQFEGNPSSSLLRETHILETSVARNVYSTDILNPLSAHLSEETDSREFSQRKRDKRPPLVDVVINGTFRTLQFTVTRGGMLTSVLHGCIIFNFS